jgi:hypothetical protein
MSSNDPIILRALANAQAALARYIEPSGPVLALRGFDRLRARGALGSSNETKLADEIAAVITPT